MDRVLDAARTKGLSTDDVLDALLRMELSLRTLSRVKPAYAYRPEALTPSMSTARDAAPRSAPAPRPGKSEDEGRDEG